MSPPGASAADTSSAKRRQILDGARQVFSELGYERASVDQIAARAGVSKATVYNHFQDKKAILGEIELLKGAAAAVTPRFTELFMTEPSPGIIATTMLNAHYHSHEAYLDAIAREMRYEYQAVVKAGFVLQIDAPDKAMERVLLFQDKSEKEFVRIVEQHVAALNKALEGIPPDRVRLHVVWAKLKTCRAGADLASSRLWGKAGR